MTTTTATTTAAATAAAAAIATTTTRAATAAAGTTGEAFRAARPRGRGLRWRRGGEAFAFAPPTITAKVGQTVTWENHDPADHTVTAEDGSFDSGTMAEGVSFETTFDSPGEYRYICALHPGMRGTVVVEG